MCADDKALPEQGPLPSVSSCEWAVTRRLRIVSWQSSGQRGKADAMRGMHAAVKSIAMRALGYEAYVPSRPSVMAFASTGLSGYIG